MNGTALALTRRLLDEASSTPYETAVGNFLAAQSRCITSDPFLQLCRRPPRD